MSKDKEFETVTSNATPKLRGYKVPAPAPVDPTKHAGHEVNRRKAHYVASCPACQREDEERRSATEPQIPADELYRTIFLVPNYQPEHNIAMAYIKRRYPAAPNIGSSINYQLVPQMPEIQIVVVCRRVAPGFEITPYQTAQLRADNKWVDVPTPMAELLPEVLESAPIVVGDYCDVTQNSLVQEGAINVDRLVDALADAAPGYRVFKGNPPDQLIELKSA